MMRPPRRHVSAASVVVALSLIAAIAVIVWVLSIVRTEPTPADPTPIPSGTPVSTPVATPSSSPGPRLVPQLPLVTVDRIDRGTLPELLRYSPDRLADDSLPLSDVAQYANIEAWMHDRHIATPEGPDDPAFAAWEEELDNLAIPNVLATRASDGAWAETYGFRLSDVDQVLAVGQAPDFVLVMRGDFEEEALLAAWAESGYQAIRSQDLTLWTLFPGDAVDLSAPASRPALGNMNNVVLLEDGTLIATSRLARLEQAIRAVRGEEGSLDENPAIASLLSRSTFPHRLDTAVILKGSILATSPATPVVMATPEDPVSGTVATPATDPAELPQASLMLAGLVAQPGLDAPPQLSMVLSYETADDATRAMIRADRAIRTSDSPVTGEPYNERIDLRWIRVYATGEDRYIVAMLAGLPLGTADWLPMIQERDLGFVMWPWTP